MQYASDQLVKVLKSVQDAQRDRREACTAMREATERYQAAERLEQSSLEAVRTILGEEGRLLFQIGGGHTAIIGLCGDPRSCTVEFFGSDGKPE